MENCKGLTPRFVSRHAWMALAARALQRCVSGIEAHKVQPYLLTTTSRALYMTALYRLHLVALSAADDPNPHRFMTKSFGSTHRSTLVLIHGRRCRSHNRKGKGRPTIGKARKRHRAEQEQCCLLLLRGGGSDANNLLLELPCRKNPSPMVSTSSIPPSYGFCTPWRTSLAMDRGDMAA